MNHEMNAEKAVSILNQAVFAAVYLEEAAQKAVNRDGAVIADTVKAGEDVDGRMIFGSYKGKIKASKTVKALEFSIKLGQDHIQFEKRQAAIITTATTSKTLALAAK